ncbi:MAG: hypothetical protein JSW02_08315 [candidate division WOR-3 bacterium]|nr:MAG: hypothetical protein JSW02_08315 [candidate division WOR-3 bacterium]
MKRLLLVLLAAIPLFATGAGFIYYDYDYDDGGYWEEEYWHDSYWYDGAWVYYPHGYYCVYYVWWYPWWWDWYWYRCHWHHHFHWDFFYAGYYVVWYDAGVWWFRPRYGRWVQYRLPYAYHEIRYRAVSHGIYLPAKPPREIHVPYKETTIKNLIREKDPQAYRTIEKAQKDGSLYRMQTQYQTKTQNQILQKNKQYGIKDTKQSYNQAIKKGVNVNHTKKTYTPLSRETKSSQVSRDSKKAVNTQPRYNESKERSIKQEPQYKKTTEQKRTTKSTKQVPRYEERKSTKKVTSTKTTKQTPRYEEKKSTKKATNTKVEKTPQYKEKKSEKNAEPQDKKSTKSYQKKESPTRNSKEKSTKTPTKTRNDESAKQVYTKTR